LAKRVTDLVDLIFRPTGVFRRLKDHPSWVVSFAALAIVSMVLEWFSFRTALQTTVGGLPQRATPEMIQDAVAYLESRRFINLLLTPLKLWILIAMFSYVIYLVCSVSKSISLPHWKHFLAVVVWSYWILIVGEALSLVTRSVVGPFSSNSGLAFPQLLGLGMIRISSSDLGLLYALNAVNVFSVWYLLLVSLGVSILCGFSRVKGILITAFVWLFGIVLSAAIIRFTVAGVH
jgi:hypothetical protein